MVLMEICLNILLARERKRFTVILRVKHLGKRVGLSVLFLIPGSRTIVVGYFLLPILPNLPSLAQKLNKFSEQKKELNYWQ